MWSAFKRRHTKKKVNLTLEKFLLTLDTGKSILLCQEGVFLMVLHEQKTHGAASLIRDLKWGMLYRYETRPGAEQTWGKLRLWHGVWACFDDSAIAMATQHSRRIPYHYPTFGPQTGETKQLTFAEQVAPASQPWENEHLTRKMNLFSESIGGHWM